LAIELSEYAIDDGNTTGYVFIVINLLSVVVAIFLVERLRRLFMIRTGSFGMIISNICITIGLILKNIPMTFCSLIVFLFSYEISIGTLKYIYIAEVTNISMASIAISLWWLANMIIAILIPYLIQNGVFYIAGILFTAMSILVYIVSLFMYETSGIGSSSTKSGGTAPELTESFIFDIRPTT
jgi:hypothetical protein